MNQEKRIDFISISIKEEAEKAIQETGCYCTMDYFGDIDGFKKQRVAYEAEIWTNNLRNEEDQTYWKIQDSETLQGQFEWVNLTGFKPKNPLLIKDICDLGPWEHHGDHQYPSIRRVVFPAMLYFKPLREVNDRMENLFQVVDDLYGLEYCRVFNGNLETSTTRKNWLIISSLEESKHSDIINIIQLYNNEA